MSKYAQYFLCNKNFVENTGKWTHFQLFWLVLVQIQLSLIYIVSLCAWFLKVKSVFLKFNETTMHSMCSLKLSFTHIVAL